MTTIHHHDVSGVQQTLARFDYTVDARGNRTQAVEQRQPSGGGALQPQTHVYTYDGVERVTGATTYPNATPTGTPIRTFAYGYDLAGNRTSAALIGTPTSYAYNNRNQLTSDGTHTFSYDKNGNRISDGTLTTEWDRAGRMLSHDGHSYAYDGEGRRIAQTAGGSTTRYVLDVRRGLPAVIEAKAGSDVTHYMHGPLGMFAQRNSDASWDWMLHDGLGSVRGVFDGTLQSAAEYDPFGEPIVAPSGTAYGFTGELTDGNGLLYLRARYLAPGLGTFASRDPWRGSASAPRTWNGYAWVEGNVVNRVDPGGMASCMATANPVASTQVAAIPCDLVPEAEREAMRLVGACAYDSALKDASVVVQYFYNGQPNADGTSCIFPDNTPGLANQSLGVLTEAGLWTHDHFDIRPLIQDAEGKTRIDPASIRVAADTAEAAEFLRSYGCVELRGSRGTQVLTNVTADLAASGSGILHVPLVSPETIGVPISLGSLPPEGTNARIQFAYIRNTNERCIINNGVTLANPIATTETGCAWSDIEIGGAESSFSIQSVNPQDIGSRLGVEFRGTGYAGANEALPTQGDSGGGFFHRGQFIGLMLAGPAAAGGRGTYYFSPVRR